MKRVAVMIQRFNMYCYGASALLLILITLITFADVVGRYFRVPVPGTLELTQLAISCVVFLTLAHTQAVKGHIFLEYALPLPPKAQTVLDTLLTLISLFVMAILTWKSVPLIIDAYRNNEWSDYHHIPLFLIKVVVFIGGLSFCLQLIIDIVEILKQPGRTASGNAID
jgi:TRAP-type transport system small permease protein